MFALSLSVKRNILISSCHHQHISLDLLHLRRIFLVRNMTSKEVKCIKCNKIIYTADKNEKFEGKVCFHKMNFDEILSIVIDLS
jgi:hypothetical protein